MTYVALRHRVYRRLETDDEFRARLHGCKRVAWTMMMASQFHGEALDDWADEHYRVQRRIVEVQS